MTTADIMVVTESLSANRDQPNFAFHFSFWVEGVKYKTKPVYGFATRKAACEAGHQRFGEAISLRRSIMEAGK